MKPNSLATRDTAKSIMGSVESKMSDLWAYMRETDAVIIKSDMRDIWLLWSTVAKVYSKAGAIVIKRGPGIVQDMRRLPWMLNMMDLRNLFRAARGRKGPYREAILTIMEKTAESAVDYVMKVLKQPDRVVYFQSAALCLSELLEAMDLVPFLDMAPPVLSVVLAPDGMEKYMDFAVQSGMAGDACSLTRSAQGLLLKGQYPKSGVIVGNNGCEGQVNTAILYEKTMKLPSFVTDVPNDFKSKRALEWYSKEVMRMVKWLEENTPGRMDWDRLKEICEERNKTVEAEMELWDMMRMKPTPLAGEVVWLSHLIGVAMMGGKKTGTEMMQKLAECAKENIRRGQSAIPSERHRSVVWHPTMAVHWHLYRYLEQKWGTVLLQDSMAFNDLGFIDTSSNESMIRDIAKHIMNTPMALIARGTSEYYLDHLFYIYDHWDLDMILVGDHIGCKSVAGMIGMLKDICRKRGIPVCLIPYDLMDPRFASWEDVTNTVDQFMETVMMEEPLVGKDWKFR
jgi:benzoyl-CoA reductase/2-hydroxyglutaryl-CoA dehydratase subunit BcrC/BadD/HgdB